MLPITKYTARGPHPVGVRVHRLVAALVTGFFAATLGDEAGLPDLSSETLASLDTELDRLDVGDDSKGATR